MISYHSSEIGIRGNIPVADALTGLGLPSKFQPTFQSEVYAFRAIETQVKAGVVASGKCDNEFPSLLDKNIGPARRLRQSGGGSKERFMAQKLRTLRSVLREISY
jgi:hypothetical protein